MERRARRLATAAALLLAFSAAGPADASDADILLEGVAKIAAPGVPGPLCAFGADAFVVAVGGENRLPVVAASTFGAGRVVAFGHTGYFGQDALATGDTARLVRQAARWAAGRKGEGKRRLRIGIRSQDALRAVLAQEGIEIVPLGGDDWIQRLKRVDVLGVGSHSLRTDDEIEDVRAFVRRGGGLLTGGLGWGWLQLNAGKTLQDHPGNRLLAPAGIVWMDGTLARTADVGYAIEREPLALAHAGAALDLLEAQARGAATPQKRAVQRASATLTAAVQALPSDDKLLLPRLRRLRADRTVSAVPSPDKPLTWRHGLARVLLTMDLRDIAALPAQRVEAHPSASGFPGDVPRSARKTTKTVEIVTAREGEPRQGPYAASGAALWHSTGLYAAPGERIQVAIPGALVEAGLHVRIGAHNDRIWHKDAWKRVPEITTRTALEAKNTSAANPWGGLVYIEAPRALRLDPFRVTVRGAVEAPYFVLGQTTGAAWREKIRLHPAPWAELATSKVILTVPAHAIRELDDPEGLMTDWDRVLDACADLAARPRERSAPERYVADVQISAGSMHSGYPIMTHLDAVPAMVDRALLFGKTERAGWGQFHEMGHNHQAAGWTFAGTVEVTCNLFTMYVMETVCGRERTALRKGFPYPPAKLKAYLETGPDFGRWKAQPFLALMTYYQLVDAFGWDAFKKVFAEYRDLPRDLRPKTDDQKRDEWMVRFSRTVGRNLGPFFQAWGIPTSERARKKIADLPPWMPDGFPPP